MKTRFVTPWIVLVLTLTGTTSARADSSTDALLKRLNGPWIPKGGTVRIGQSQSPQAPDATRFGELITLMQLGTESNTLLNDITTRLGYADPSELRSLMLLCDQKVSVTVGAAQDTDGNGVNDGMPIDTLAKGNAGHISVLIQPYSQAHGPGVTDTPWSDDTLAAKAAALASREIITPVEKRLNLLEPPTICLDRRATLADTFITLDHELVHLKGYLDRLDQEDAPERIDVLKYPDADAYAQGEIAKSGGEIDAYKAQVRAIRSLEKTARVGKTSAAGAEQFFNAQGQLTDPAGLKKLLLKSGYAKFFAEQYKNQLTRESLRIPARIKTLTDWIAWVDQSLAQGPDADLSIYRQRLTDEITALGTRLVEVKKRLK